MQSRTVKTPVAAYAVRAGCCQERFTALPGRVAKVVPKALRKRQHGTATAGWVALDGGFLTVVQAMTGSHNGSYLVHSRGGGKSCATCLRCSVRLC